MIHFLTLFLSLTVGVQPVEMAVADARVASIEILLDGASVGRVEGPPWVVECDFGDDLRPHVLEAVARDASGLELERIEQRINLPRPMAEVGIVIEGGEVEPYRARIVWDAVDQSQPTRVDVSLDGKALPVSGSRVVELPKIDRRKIHVLSAELVLNEAVLARSEVAFGGPFGDEVSSDLTAVPLQLLEDAEFPTTEELQRWITVDGGAVHVVGIERETWDVLLVRDRDARESLESLSQRAGFMAGRFTSRTKYFLRRGLRETDSLRFVLTSPRLVPSGDGTTALFQVSPSWAEQADGSLPRVLLNILPVPDPRPQHFAWSVASSGLTLAGGHRPRAVILVKEQETEDAGSLDPTAVRGYLEALRVPLFVWRPSKINFEIPHDGWGYGRDTSRLSGLNKAVRELHRSLDSQFIVWIEGDHMPQQLRLSPDARKSLRFAGELPDDSQ